MKKLLFLAAAGVLLLTGCSKETSEEGPAPRPTERLGIAEDTDAPANGISANAIDSRAAFDGAGKIVWKADDQINVNGKAYTIAQAEDQSWYVDVDAADSYKAVYPASAYVSATTCALPAAQTYAEGSFDPAAFCAYCEILPGEKLVFKHLGGMFRFTIKGDTKISSVALKGNNGEILAGTGTLTTGADTHKYLDITSGQTTVTLNCPDVQLTPEGVQFHMVVPVREFAQGFKVVVTSADNTSMTRNKTTAGAIARADIMNMPAFDYVGTAPQIAYSTDGGENYTDWVLGTNDPAGFTTLKVNAPASAPLTEAHLKVIDAVITALPIDADKKIEIDLSDAIYASTTFPNLFGHSQTETNTKSFRFPKNITGLAVSPAAATSCMAGKRHMTTIVLPAKLTVIPDWAFAWNEALTEIGYYDETEADGVKWNTLPPACTQIGSFAFALCSKLLELNLYAPTMVTIASGSYSSFYNCSQGAAMVVIVPSNLLSTYKNDANWKATGFTFQGR